MLYDPYLSASEVVFHEEALYQVYVPLPFYLYLYLLIVYMYCTSGRGTLFIGRLAVARVSLCVLA